MKVIRPPRRPAAAGLLLLLAAPPATLAAAEEKVEVQRGTKASAPVKPDIVKVDLRDLPRPPEWEPGDGIKEIPRRHTHPPRIAPLRVSREPREDPLHARQEAASIVADVPAPAVSFAGQGFTGVTPPDTVGDVSPSHFIQAVNRSGGTSIIVYDKTGGVAAGPFILDTLVAGGLCANGLGDPVVLYDPLADRWLLSEFSGSGNALCVYISQTSDPVSGGWFRYQFVAPSFPDYPKYGVWPDAYYVSTNESSPAVYAFDRTRMLAGLGATMQRFVAPDLPGFGFQALTPADLDGATPPPAGAPGIFMRHRDDESHPPASAGQDFLQIFEFHVDWATPANSTFTGPINIAVTEFDSDLCGLFSFSCVPQPSGPPLDPLREVVMFRLQYRNFGSHQTLVSNLVTDVTGADFHGVRWFELRKTGPAWVLHQEGTYAPGGIHRWMGSAAMDGSGNIMVGYNASNAGLFPSLRYAGRLAGDPPGLLAQGEAVLRSGAASNSNIRYGDYSAMTVDPVDDCTFWFTGEYSPASSWGTWIGAMKFPSCGVPPPPDFSIACSPAGLSVAQGGNGTSTCTVTSTAGFASEVLLDCAGFPAGVTCGYVPPSVTPPADGSASSTLTVSVDGAVPTGNYSFPARGTSGADVRSFTLSLSVTPGGGDQTAVFDPLLGAPRCGTVGRSCDAGASLLLGRDGKGPEPNQPNTLGGTCADGLSGTFHVDESHDRLRVSTTDSSNFAPGKTVTIEATVWAWTTPSADKLDLYYATDAHAPVWTFLTTLTPAAAGAQTLTFSYTLPKGSLQAVRAQFRYQGSASACTAGGYNDRDDLVFAVDSPPGGPPANTAVFDPTLQAPRCGTSGRSCDSGPSLLLGRAGLGPEVNQPNTLGDSCADGSFGAFHADESLDRLTVSTLDGTALAAGKTVRIDATVWAWSNPSLDRLDLYYATSASAPTWTLLTTLTPASAGPQVLSTTHVLAAGSLQAIRGRFRYQGAAASCATGSYDDHDDLVFAVP